jgi:hypothetical protein
MSIFSLKANLTLAPHIPLEKTIRSPIHILNCCARQWPPISHILALPRTYTIHPHFKLPLLDMQKLHTKYASPRKQS